MASADVDDSGPGVSKFTVVQLIQVGTINNLLTLNNSRVHFITGWFSKDQISRVPNKLSCVEKVSEGWPG